MNTKTTTVIAELQQDQALSITKVKKDVGSFHCVGDARPSKGKQNMSAFSVFKTFSEIETYTFFTMMDYRDRVTNEVCAEYVNDYTEYEVKRFNKAIKSLIEKDCLRLVSKRSKTYMINPKLILGAFDMYEHLVNKYEKLPK